MKRKVKAAIEYIITLVAMIFMMAGSQADPKKSAYGLIMMLTGASVLWVVLVVISNLDMFRIEDDI